MRCPEICIIIYYLFHLENDLSKNIIQWEGQIRAEKGRTNSSYEHLLYATYFTLGISFDPENKSLR